MTPAKRIIMRFYAKNIFMMDPTQKDLEKNLEAKDQFFKSVKSELQQQLFMDLTTRDIESKFEHLLAVFKEADRLNEAKEKMTYLQNCIHHRLHFLKPFIKESTINTYGSTLPFLSSSSSIHEELKEYCINLKCNAQCETSITSLNLRLNQYEDPALQRRAFCTALESFKEYETELLKMQSNLV